MEIKHAVTFILCIVLLFGCTQNQQKETSLKKQAHQEKVSNKQIADHLSEVAHSVPGVNEALVTIIGSYAIVGIDVESQLDSSRVETIKYSVSEALRKDSHGINDDLIVDTEIRKKM